MTHPSSTHRAVVFALVLVAGACVRHAEPEDRIVFSSNRDGSPELYVMGLDGREPVRLTNNDGLDTNPDWSPDGSRIVFTSDMDGTLDVDEPGGPSDLELYVMEADGSEVIRLTHNTRFEGAADWSPSGSQLVFDATDPFDVLQVYVMDADGRQPPAVLTSEALNGTPVWSADGDRIAFVSLRDEDLEIYTMAPDGSDQINLTNDPAGDVHPAWSPDGSTIAFTSDRDGNREIYVMAADGSDPRRLTDDAAEDTNPSWSPDGRHIVFTSERDGDMNVYEMRSDGSEVRNLYGNDSWDVVPDWTLTSSPTRPEPPTPEPELQASDVERVKAELKGLVENVTEATAVRYGARDDLGNEMDTVNIIAAPGGGFVGLYHSYRAATYRVHLATSSDLMNWAWKVTLAEQASMPTIEPAPGGGYVVAWEQEPGNHLKFAYYESWTDLLDGAASKTLDAPRRFSSCAEGTPNLYVASRSWLDVGFHYFGDCELDRQARGTSDWTSWSPVRQPLLDDALEAHGVMGGIGDRDDVTFEGIGFTLLEGQVVKNDWRTWRIFLLDDATGEAEQLSFRTDAGSFAFTNPTIELIEIGGRAAILVTLFVPQEGAAGSEVGELIYYRILEPAGT